MTFDKWVEKYKGTKIDYDKVYGVQCVDLIKHFVKHVLEVEPQSIGNAIEYYNKRNTSKYLTDNFTNYDYKSGFKFKKGDVLVLKGTSKYGHISVCTGKQDTKGVYAYDENYKGSGDGMTLRHYEFGGYYKMLNILRPKAQDKVLGTKPKTPAKAKTLFGIDISKWNHNKDKSVDISKLTCDFVIPKIGGTGWGTGKFYTDTYYTQHMDALKKVKMPASVYWYGQEITVAEGQAAAKYVIKLVKKYNIALPIYYDSELSDAHLEGKVGRADNLSKKLRTDIIIAFGKEIKKAGYRVGVYASTSWLDNKLELSRLVAEGFSIWEANYIGKPKVARYDIWQYASNGVKVNGVKGAVDVNYMVKDIIKKSTSTTTKPATTTKPTTTPTTKPTPVKYFPKYKGKSVSIVDALNSLKYDSSFSYRKKIAKANGIKVYLGTSKQNTSLLTKLKAGKLIKP